MISTSVYYVAPEDLTEEDGSSNTITGSKMFPHKKDFDSLSYEGKLNFWKANKADPDCWHYAVMKSKTEKPVKFSIKPDSNTEKELYIEWRTQLIKDMFKNTKHHEDWLKVWDCDKIKEDFYLITANKKNKIEIIEACKLQITKHKEQLNISSVKLGYDYYNSTTKREYFYTIFEKTYFNFEDFLKGINCAELIAFYKNEIKCLESNEISSLGTDNRENIDNYKNTIWFKVGLLFATGEMDKLITRFNGNATQIAKHLQNKNYRPFISESISKTNKNDKNVFSDQGKLLKIQKHCIENKILMIDSFTKQIKPE